MSIINGVRGKKGTMGGQTEDEVKEGIIIKEHFSQTRFDKLNLYFLNINKKPSQHLYVGLRMLVQFFHVFTRFMITINYFSKALSQICLVSFSVCKNLSAEKPCLQFNAAQDLLQLYEIFRP